MDYKEQRRVDEAADTLTWMRDRIEELETDVANMEEAEKDNADKIAELEEQVQQMIEDLRKDYKKETENK